MSNNEEIFKKQLNQESFSAKFKTKNDIKMVDFKKSNFDEILSQIPSDDEYKKELEENIKKLSGLTKKRVLVDNEGDSEYKSNSFDDAPRVNILDLVSSEEDVRVVVEHVFCPSCGEELFSSAPVIYNPFDLKKIVRIECNKCNFKAITDTSVPHIKFYNKNNEVIKAFNE